MMPSRCTIEGNSHCGRPKGRNSPPEEGQKQKSSHLCNFFSIRGSLPPLQSENWPLYGQFSTFSRPDPRFGATRQSLIAKKLQSEPIFCFQAPMTAFGKAMGETARAQCCRWSGCGCDAVGSDPGTTPQKRQMDGMRNIAAKRRLKRTLVCRPADQNEKGARIKRTPLPKHELNAIQQHSLQPQQQQLLQQPLPLRLLQQQQQPQPLQQP